MRNTGIPDGANEDERAEAQEAAKAALDDLPVNASDRQVGQAKERAVAPIRERIAARVADEQDQARRQELLSWVPWRLASMSDADKKAAITEVEEALESLAPGTFTEEMEAARDRVIDRYRKKTDLVEDGLREVRRYAEKMLKTWEFDPTETAADIYRRLYPEVKEALEEDLDGTESSDFVTKMVHHHMRELEGCR